jgi:hypothetical protein
VVVTRIRGDEVSVDLGTLEPKDAVEQEMTYIVKIGDSFLIIVLNNGYFEQVQEPWRP